MGVTGRGGGWRWVGVRPGWRWGGGVEVGVRGGGEGCAVPHMHMQLLRN